jgi:hypothetical protein
MPAGRLKLCATGVLVAFALLPTPARAVVISPWAPIFQGIEHATGEAAIDDAGAQLLQKVNALRIDLQQPDIRFFTTPSNDDRPFETDSQTASQFLTEYELQVAVNAHFYRPCCTTAPGVPMDLRGLAISEGVEYSPVEETAFGWEMGLLLIEEDNDTRFAPSVAGDLSGAYTGVAGAPMILSVGENVSPDSDRHPRTAVGLSEDDRYLYMLTVDGRQPGFSDGATLAETADWLALFGAFDGLNLDGGGSTTMVMSDGMGGATTLNRPIHDPDHPGTQRANGSHLGVFAAPLHTNVPEPNAALVLLLAGVVLLVWRYRQRRR